MPAPLPQQQLNLRQRFSAMRNIPPFLREIWGTSKPLTAAAIGLRLVRAFLPIASANSRPSNRISWFSAPESHAACSSWATPNPISRTASSMISLPT